MTAARQLNLFKSRRQKGEQPPLALELKTHIALADLLRVGLAAGWLCNHFPAGEARAKVTAGRLKRMGLRPGWADFIFIGPTGVHHWLELKRGGANLNPWQMDFHKAMKARGVPCEVARSYEEAVTILRAWGALRTGVTT